MDPPWEIGEHSLKHVYEEEIKKNICVPTLSWENFIRSVRIRFSLGDGSRPGFVLSWRLDPDPDQSQPGSAALFQANDIENITASYMTGWIFLWIKKNNLTKLSNTNSKSYLVCSKNNLSLASWY